MRWFGLACVVIAGCGSREPAVTDVTMTAAPSESETARVGGSSVTPRRAASGDQARPPETPPPPAEDDLRRARELFQDGTKAYAAGDYALAEEAYGKAYALVPKSQILFNLGQVKLQLGKTAEACAMFEKYARDMSPLDPNRRAQLPAAKCPNLASIP